MHVLNARGSDTHVRSNIEAHYDLSNELFKTFLDADYMLYSCGIFETDMGRCGARGLTGLCSYTLEHGCRKTSLPAHPLDSNDGNKVRKEGGAGPPLGNVREMAREHTPSTET